ncbi:MAG: F0F1 ATP synthase subunit beta, partial [Chloroflexi bacterium]|nr:F0F1 ATP synthase subunit beta [Chloroflexota bacterium]
MATGKIVQIVGAVVDVEFGAEDMPPLFTALEVEASEGGLPVTLEVQQHVGNSWVRCIAMTPTEGLKRGAAVRDTGGPISVPVGDATLGRVFDVTGRPVDGGPPVEVEKSYPIHR